MYMHETAPNSVPTRSLLLWQAISIALRNAMKRIRSDLDAIHDEHDVSELPPHLRYDIGAIDHQPRPLTLAQIEHAQRKLLAIMRQRYF